jgi:hypothetical protein
MEVPSWIIAVISIAVVFFVTAIIGLFFLGTTSLTACNFFSKVRHIWKHFCIQTFGIQLFCAADMVESVTGFIAGQRLTTPLLGCKTREERIAQVADYDDLLQRISRSLIEGWIQYGKGELDVLWERWENPAMVSVIYADLGAQELNAGMITQFLRENNFTIGVDCRGCADPCLTPGYTCREDFPTQCEKWEDNPFLCMASPDYRACNPPFTRSVLMRDYDECKPLLVDYLCPPDYVYNEATDECENIYTGATTAIVPPDAFNIQDITECKAKEEECECLICNDTYGEIHLPNHCFLTEEANPECKRAITYADILKPGIRLLYSFANSTHRLIVDANDTDFNVSGRIYIFVEYIDAFTRTRKVPHIANLPPECAAATFMDSCKICIDNCVRGVVGEAHAGASIYSLLLQDKLKEQIKTGVSLVTWEGAKYLLGLGIGLIGECLHCLARVHLIGADIVACEDIILLCVYEE